MLASYNYSLHPQLTPLLHSSTPWKKLHGFLAHVCIVSVHLSHEVEANSRLDFLTQAGLMLTVGQILTVASTKSIYLISISIFELGSLICGVAPSSKPQNTLPHALTVHRIYSQRFDFW